VPWFILRNYSRNLLQRLAKTTVFSQKCSIPVGIRTRNSQNTEQIVSTTLQHPTSCYSLCSSSSTQFNSFIRILFISKLIKSISFRSFIHFPVLYCPPLHLVNFDSHIACTYLQFFSTSSSQMEGR